MKCSHFSLVKATWRCLRDGKAAEQFRPFFIILNMKQFYFKNFTLFFFIIGCLKTIAAVKIGDIYYNFSGDNAIVTYNPNVVYSSGGQTYYNTYSYNNVRKDIVIPETINYNGKEYTVTEIGSFAFADSWYLPSVSIPKTINKIGKYAFRNCNSLRNSGKVIIPDLTTWFNITFVNSESCPEGALYDYSNNRIDNNNVVIPMDITVVKSYSLKLFSRVTIPDHIKKIESFAFGDKQNYSWGYIDSKSIKIPDVSSWCNIEFEENALPQKWDLTNKNGQFVSSLDIPQNVTTIPNNSFAGCLIESVKFNANCESIGDNAFADCMQLSSISIPNSVKTLSASAFSGCENISYLYLDCTEISSCFSNLTKINYIDLGKNVRTIGENAFSGCTGLLLISISDGLNSIEKGAFKNCRSLSFIYPPNGLKTIGSYCFENCSSLKEINIPEGVTSITDGTFVNCKSLINITMPNSLKTITYSSYGKKPFDGCTNLKTVSFDSHFSSQNLESIFGSQVENYIVGENVTTIRNREFWGCSSMKKLVLLGNITNFGSDVFEKCDSLNTIEINSKEIGSWFKSLSSLNTILFGDNVEIIGDYAFSDCTGLTRINLPPNLIHIGSSTFKGCSGLNSVIIGNSVTSIGKNAFQGCTGLNSVIIGNNVMSIGDCAFNNCSGITSITIPNSVTTIGDNAFSGCSQLTEVTLSKGNLTGIGDEAFSLTNLTSIILSDGVKNLGGKVFKDCKQLSNVTMTNSVENIGSSAFAGCENLKSITLSDYLKQISDGMFEGCYNASAIILPSNITSIGTSAFKDCTGLTEIRLPNKVSAIGDTAFENCSNLALINIPSSLKTVGKNAFEGCSSMDKVTISDLAAWCGITFANSGTYYQVKVSNPLSITHHLYNEDGTEIKDLIIPDGVETINSYAFYGGSNFASVTIPASLKKIGSSSFSGCTNLAKVTVSDLAAWCNTNFGDNPLSYARRLYNEDGTEIQDLTIPTGVGMISSGAFAGCSSLKSLVIPNGLEYVGYSAFADCENLATIVIPNTVKEIGSEAFANCMSLYSVTSLINMPFNLDESVFRYTGYNYDKDIIYMAATLYVPRGRTAIYRNVQGWKKFTNIMETDTKFNLTYLVDGEVYKKYEIQATEVITPEPDPYKEGYIFSGWSTIPRVMPAHDVTVTGSFYADPSSVKGDVNGDGKVGIGDIVTVTNVMAGEGTEEVIKRADVNGDGEVGIGDIISITNVMAGQ